VSSASRAPSQVRYRVVHTTRYEYPGSVRSGHHLAHLTPRETTWQRVLHHHVEIDPAPAETSRASDYFGNPVWRFVHHSPHATLDVIARSELEIASQQPRWRAVCAWEEAARDTPIAADDPALAEFRLASPLVPVLPAAVAYARESFAPGRDLLDALRELTGRIRADFVFDPFATTVATPVTEVAHHRRGVCQDFAHFMLSGLRGLGLAARYTSGYVYTGGAQGAAARGADTSHAWVGVHSPDTGWIGCDPTNGKLADLEFVTLGWGRDFADVTPLRGVLVASGTNVPQVAVEVTRL
jgi:transglutaminase-like putative cysteine protease